VTGVSKKRIVVVCGPTGSGKTGLAIHLAREFNAEIVGADSMQIYRTMDIGTAKPTPAEQAAAPHHMIDIVDPDEDFDAAAYAKQATGIIRRIHSRGNVAFVVGGTGFYIKALLYGLFEQGPSDAAVRRRLKRQVEKQGTAELHRQLADVDQESAQRIHPNDTYRIIRALEVFTVTGEPLSVYQRRHGFRQPRFHVLEIGVSWPRERLYQRINQRVDAMMAQGFLDEVQRLLAKGYARDLKSMQSLGYRHLAAVLEDGLPLDDAVTALKRDHRRYAKRQLTWFGTRQSICWITPDQVAAAGHRIRNFLS
jgi:tRNA dimethylallyltransferase